MPAAVRRIDGHAHVASTHFIPKDFLLGVARNMIAKVARRSLVASESEVMRHLVAQHQDHQADQLVAEMENAGIDSTVLLLPDFTLALHCELDMAEMSARHHAIRQRHPGRFHVFQGVDPRRGAEGARFFEHTLREYGFEGLKLYPPCGYSPSDPRLNPYYEICEAHRVPVLFHSGPTSPALPFGFSHPDLVDDAALRFPRVNFIIAHGGVTNVDAAAALCAYRPNVYLDISGFTSSLHPRGWQGQLGDLFRMKINHKIIFGTDWPLAKSTGTLKQAIDQLLAATGPLQGIPAHEINSIMGGCMNHLLPPLRAVARGASAAV